MAKRRTLKEKLLSVFLMVAVTITMIPGGLMLQTETAAAANGTYEYTVSKTKVQANGYIMPTTLFKVKTLATTGLCCDPGPNSKNGKAKCTRISNTSKTAKLAYYYGVLKKSSGYMDANAKRLKFERALARTISTGRSTFPFSGSELDTFISASQSTTVPNRFECYSCIPTGSSQSFISWKMTDAAGLIREYIAERGGSFILSSDSHNTQTLCRRFEYYKDYIK